MNQSEEKAKRTLAVLAKEKRADDFLAGYSDGTLYLMILHGADENAAQVALDRLKKQIESKIEDIKISWTIARFPEDGQSTEALIRRVTRADQSSGL